MYAAHHHKRIVLISVFGQAWSGYWDVYSHSLIFRSEDPPLNPAHLALFVFTGAALVSSWLLRDVNFGYRITSLGVIIQLFSGLVNEAIHQTIGDPKPISPPHALLVAGMIIAQVGLVFAYSVDRSLIRRDLYLIFSYATLWLTAAGSAIYVAGVFLRLGVVYLIVPLLTLTSALILVPMALTSPRWGLLLALAIFYPANIIPIFAMSGQSFLSASPLCGMALELARSYANRKSPRASAGSTGGAIGLLFPLTFHPFTQQFLSTSSFIQILVALAFAGVIGCLTGLASMYIMKRAVSKIYTSTNGLAHSRPF